MIVARTVKQTGLPVWNEEIMLVPLGYVIYISSVDYVSYISPVDYKNEFYLDYRAFKYLYSKSANYPSFLQLMKRNGRSSAKDRSGHITAARGWVMRLLQVNVLGLSRPLSPRGRTCQKCPPPPPLSPSPSLFLTLIGSILRWLVKVEFY
ncbi:hypothetical protein CDAR_175531 [Caerostris darwini]|uniref:Uncharacterized protein n=1 Tax=Caerostris darwini TaxID=1538125 RepID=A0AAV4RYM2_9ARAC|nr:hypothetical protein CDAR_175531 [Caerostris darwini]